jgi:ATP-binding cassette subfamily B protein
MTMVEKMEQQYQGKVEVKEGIKRINRYAEGHRKLIVKAVLYILISVIAGIVAYVFSYGIIDGLINFETIDISNMGMFALLICFCGALKGFFFNRGLANSHEAAYHILFKMRQKLAAKMVTMPLGDVHAKGHGSFKRKIVEDVETIEVLLAHMIPEGLPYLIAPIIVYPIIFLTDWRLGLLALGSLPFGIISMGIMFKVGNKRTPEWYESTNTMNKTIVDYVTGIEVIKIFGRTTEAYQRYSDSIQDYNDLALRWWRESLPWLAMFTVLLPATIMFLLPVGLYFYLIGTLELTPFIFAIILSLSLGHPLLKLLRLMPALPMLSIRVLALEEIYTNRDLQEGNQEIDTSDYTISFNNVSFAYENEQVIKDVSFEIEYGILTAICGESGSGKSTLARLLLHYWDIDEGTIRIGDTDLRDTTVEKLMEHISYVEQETFLFNLSLGENIRLGNLEATDEEVVNAAKAAACHEFISELPNGYESNAGDAGVKLSGGELQRITLARAIIRNAPIIVLDEATAYADPENKDKIHKAIEALTKGKTVIVIAHQLSTIVKADQIIVLDKGKIVDINTHEQLLERCDVYQNLWNAHQKSLQWTIEVKK